MMNPMRRSLHLILLLPVLSACAVDAPAPALPAWQGLWPEFAASPDSVNLPAERPAAEPVAFRPRALDPKLKRRVNYALDRYLQHEDSEFEIERRALAAEDPLAAYWIARTLAAFVVKAHRAGVADERSMVGEPAWKRPTKALVELGAAAAPMVVLELLCSPVVRNRELGSEILAQMGPSVLPTWERVFGVGDEGVRRAAAKAMVGWGQPTPQVSACLEQLVGDSDFGVRACAYQTIGLGGGPTVAARLRVALESEDAFVQRAIAKALGRFRDRDTATSLVDYLSACVAAQDHRGSDAAVVSLQTISGLSGPRPLTAWRAWVRTYSGS